jgi:hypothetical protein
MKEKLPTGPIVSNATGQFQKQNLSRFIKNKTDEANFQNILTAELYSKS